MQRELVAAGWVLWMGCVGEQDTDGAEQGDLVFLTDIWRACLSQAEPFPLLARIEELRVLSAVADAGLLSSAEVCRILLPSRCFGPFTLHARTVPARRSAAYLIGLCADAGSGCLLVPRERRCLQQD